MITVNSCFNKECIYHTDDHECELLWGIEIDEDGECMNKEEKADERIHKT